MDRLSKVTSELDTFGSDADGLFIEYPAETMTLRQYGRLLGRVPAYAFGALLLHLLVYSPLFLLFNRDLYPTEMAAVQRVADDEIPVHRVDEHPNETLSQAGPWMMLANWLVFAAVVWVEPLSTAVTAVVAVVGGLLPQSIRRRGYRYLGIGLALLGTAGGVGLLLSGFFSGWLLGCGVVFFGVVLRTLDHRNEVMLDRVVDQSVEAGYDDVVLVTGRAHLGGMAAIARERGLSVPRIHVPKWLRAGRTVSEFEPSELPTLGSDTLSTDTDGPHPQSGLEPLVRRGGAAVIDLFLISIPTGVLWVLLLVVGTVTTADPGAAFGLLLLAVGGGVLVSYHVLLEWLFGTTVGKRLFGLTVVDREASELSATRALARNLLRPVSLVAGYLVGGLLVATRDQHFGDRLAGTIVVAAERLSDEPPDAENPDNGPSAADQQSTNQSSATTETV